MPKRLVIVAGTLLPMGLLAAGAAIAEPLNADAARRFVVGKTFAYTCFDGTRGAGRIYNDGSVAGTVQIRGVGPMKSAALPAGTLQVKGENVCASVRGLPFEPCFNLNKTNDQSFRGSVSGLGFAYCDFTRRGAPAVRTSWSLRPSSRPLQLEPVAPGAQANAKAAE